MANILPQIEHIIVVMLENRSLDNMCGWIFSDPQVRPNLFLPVGSPQIYDGLNSTFWNPSNADYFSGQPAVRVPVVQGTSTTLVPNPDPEETFDNVTYQIYGPPNATQQTAMQGFVVDYQYATAANANQIMQTFAASQVPVISALAQNYAISDAWFCSVPSQTWPNRAFAHTGTSNGNVNNGTPADPLQWNVRTIFNVLNSMNVSWNVYIDAQVTPSLTRTMFPRLWDPFLDGHFHHFDQFQQDCAQDTLPQYSFIEPNFLSEPNDEHPPHDVTAGEKFLFDIWQVVSQSAAWSTTLLIITYDEHGGCYDHVLPPVGASTPDQASNPGRENFKFDRFGVRVPTVLVSPCIQAGTVFRSNTSVPYDHTSILATLRDWIGIDSGDMLPSARIASAPNLSQVLTLQEARTTLPTIPQPPTAPQLTSLALPPNDLQRSLVSGAARRFGCDPSEVLAQVQTRQHAVDFFRLRASRAHS
jgi:phospholipase C